MSAVIERRDPAALAAEIIEHMRALRERLAGEIRTYPTPIPRCDAQFNHLYEQLGRLSRDLDRIEATRESIERFIASPPYTDDAAERDFRLRVKARLG